jgi:DNA polymerase-3 subunit gamma/tau
MSVYHLKYRPKKIEELDIKEVRQSLEKILTTKEEIPRAFLFAGPKGSGKTSAARIVAKAINCKNPQKGSPCGECEFCLEVEKGSVDIIEIDAASNRGIDDVRLLRERAYLLPSRLKQKVFIVDEVHMLTKEAFNALLKLIEEPPAHTLFILCTTDTDKIPETVMSRLVRINFRRGTMTELKGSLAKIIEGEKLKVEDGVLEMVIEKCEGSFRNASRMLMEVSLELGQDLSVERVKGYFNQRGGEYSPADLEKDLLAKEIEKVLASLEKMAGAGVEFGEYRERLLRYFQEKLINLFGVGEKKDSQEWKVDDLAEWINLLIGAGKLEKEAVVSQLPLELAVVEFLGKRGGKVSTGKITGQESLEKKEAVKASEEEKAGAEKVPTVKVETKEAQIEQESDLLIKEGELGVDVTRVEAEWGNILLAVKPFNHSVEAFLRAARPKKVKGKTVVVEVFYPFHKDRLEEARNRKIVETGLKQVLGLEMLFECVLGQSRKKPLEINNETPLSVVSEKLEETKVPLDKKGDEIYDLAKEIFG